MQEPRIKPKRLHQSTLSSLPPSFSRQATPNLPPTGDALPAKPDTTLRFAYQNIRGIANSRGLILPDEIDALESLHIDVMGMSETNRPWHPDQRSSYSQMMDMRFRSSRTIYSAAPSHDRSLTYQPGGNLLTINGRTTGRVITQGSDPLGRFCWVTSVAIVTRAFFS